MGRDKVLGLSLAILLIGFAAAFCFRNEEFVENGLKLARAKLLDDVIDRHPGPKPYGPDPALEPQKTSATPVTLGAIEAVDPPADAQVAQQDKDAATIDGIATDPTPTADKGPCTDKPSAKESESSKDVASSKEPDASPIPNESAFTSTKPDRPGSAERASTALTSSAPPTVVIQPRPPVSVAPKLERQLNVVWQPAAQRRERPDGSVASSDDADRTQPPILHRVQRGDTLIRLAQMYLGNGHRYLEIYAANRDQMQTPEDRLRVGMTLRIPARHELEPAERPDRPPPARRYRGRIADTTRLQQAPMRNVSRVRQLQPTTPIQTTPVVPDADRSTLPSDDSSNTAPKDRFVPARKSPFLPQNSESSSRSGRYGRTLSQTPPRDLPADQSSMEGGDADDSRSDLRIRPATEGYARRGDWQSGSRPTECAYHFYPHGDASRKVAVRELNSGVATRVTHRDTSQYIVRKGDSLEAIASTRYGNRGGIKKILEANRDRIGDPSLLPEGTQLVIPRWDRWEIR